MYVYRDAKDLCERAMGLGDTSEYKRPTNNASLCRCYIVRKTKW
jgi:hypothetical protein